MDNEKRKTASEIIAEMREFGKQAAIVDHERVSPECLLLFADRLDAALARDIGDAQEKAASRVVLDRTLRDAAEYYAKAVLSRDGAPTSPAPNETFGDILRDMDFGRIPPHVCDVEITNHYAERIKAAINRAREDGLSGDDQFAPHYLLSAQKPSGIEQRAPGDAQKTANVAQGNVAALREALESTEELLEHFAKPGTMLGNEFVLHMRDNRAALSAPPRNCDVGTPEEQLERWESFCNRNWSTNYASRGLDPCDDCEFVEFGNCRCQLLWAQMPFATAEGGAE